MNGTEQNEKIRSMRPDRILEMFLEVVQQHPSKSYDFPISNLLDQYMQCRVVPNFTEAAMVIDSAGRVYSRKVDYLESLLLAMHDKQNAPDRKRKPDDPEQSGADKTEKKRLPGKRLKTADQTSTTIHLGPPKNIRKSTNVIEKMNLNSSDASDSDRYKNYCQAVKSKVPVFYERVNLLISDSADSNFDGSRAISKDDPDCQKNYNVFVGCISFKEKQIMSQREFLNRTQFDNLDDGFGQNNSIVPVSQGHAHNSTAINSDGHLEFAGDLTSNNDTDLLESLRETMIMENITNNRTCADDDCDSAMVDDDAFNSIVDQSTINNDQSTINNDQSTLNNDQSTLNNDQSTLNNDQSTLNNDQSTLNNDQSMLNNDQSTLNNDQSTMNNTLNLNSTADPDNTLNLTETSIMDPQTSIDNTLNASEIINSTLDISNINLTNSDNTCEVSAISNLANETANSDAQINPLSENGTLGDSFAITLNGTNEPSIIDSQVDPLSPNATTSANDAIQKTQENSVLEQAECFDDARNIFRIKSDYLKLTETFRLPLNILEQKVDIKLNMFGIPFGRLRRQVKFALTKDFDSLRTTNKRTREFDECSTTTVRKFVKLNDGTATPSIELAASSEQNIIPSDQLTDPSIVPATNTDTAETPAGVVSQPINGADSENGATAVIGENIPVVDGLIPEQTSSEVPSQPVNGMTESQDSAISDDGPSLSKTQRLESDALSAFDSGIGTWTEGSLNEGTITSRRMTLDLTPPSDQIENELSTEADELSVNRIQEMTSLSEKVHSWHQRLKPILLHSEQRNEFNVKESCKNIVECFQNRDSVNLNRDISFKDVMENRDRADTARYFFSMLQMANNENIKITVNHHDSKKLCPQDQIKLKLLNPDIRTIEIDETK